MDNIPTELQVQATAKLQKEVEQELKQVDPNEETTTATFREKLTKESE